MTFQVVDKRRREPQTPIWLERYPKMACHCPQQQLLPLLDRAVLQHRLDPHAHLFPTGHGFDSHLSISSNRGKEMRPFFSATPLHPLTQRCRQGNPAICRQFDRLEPSSRVEIGDKVPFRGASRLHGTILEQNTDGVTRQKELFFGDKNLSPWEAWSECGINMERIGGQLGNDIQPRS